MHYANGREAKAGDKIVHIDPHTGTPIAGVVCKTIEGTDTCNLEVAPCPEYLPVKTASECLHADDVIVKPEQTQPDQ